MTPLILIDDVLAFGTRRLAGFFLRYRYAHSKYIQLGVFGLALS